MRTINVEQIKNISVTAPEDHVPGDKLIIAEKRVLDDGIHPRELTSFNGFVTNNLLTALPGKDFARLLPHFEPVSLAAGQELYKFGSNITFVYFPETVVLTNVFFLEDGSSTGAAIIGSEGMAGLSAVLDSRPVSYCPRVIIAGTAIRIKLEVIKEEFHSGGPMQKLLHVYTGRRLAQLSQSAACNGRHSLSERLCTWLLMVRDRTPLERLPLTHEEIASQLGTRRAGVTSSCNALRYSGIIDYRRGQIQILDRMRLEMAACECYRALKH